MSAHNRVQHYENFPVASLLLPKHCVPAVQALYRFARTADDIADEGKASTEERLTLLAMLYGGLSQPEQAGNALITDLAPYILQGITPREDLEKLLMAFIQDVKDDQREATGEARHATMDSLLNYCTYSADPVGRMMLRITGSPCNQEAFSYSDHICTALQLINFWQDFAKDALRGRCYVPTDVFVQFEMPHNSQDPKFRPMMHYLCTDARQRMGQGLPLLGLLQGRFKAEIALTIAGGLRVLDKLKRSDYAVFSNAHRLTWRDVLPIAWHAVRLMANSRKHS